MAAVDFTDMDLAGAADVLSALRDELAERARQCRTDHPAERSQRTVLCGVLRDLGAAEDGLRKGGTALPRTDLPAVDSIVHVRA